MSLPQEKFREIVLQILYSIDVGEAAQEALVSLLTQELKTTKKNIKLAWERAQDILKNKGPIDEAISHISNEWRFERIQRVEKNILRLSVFELLYDDTIPPKVSISEAIRLSRKYSSPEAAAFVNALLDNIYKNVSGDTVADQEIEVTFEALIAAEEVPEE